jgi:hypothetical protein
MGDDWKVYRPAIWTAMLGVAVALLVSPAYLGAIPIGASIGMAARIRQRQRRRAAAQSAAARSTRAKRRR